MQSSATQPYRRWFQQEAGRVWEWKDCVEPGALAVFLNFQGEADLVWSGGQRLLLRAGQMCWLRAPVEGLTARRLPGRERHECLALYFPDAWMASILRGAPPELPEGLAPLVRPPFSVYRRALLPLTAEDRMWARSFMAPHLCEQARLLLDAARLTEFFLRHLLQPAGGGEPVRRSERLARERIERVKAATLARLDDPPLLEKLAALAGCSPHYLSRTFSRLEGCTYSLWLRRERIERAAGLIASGQCNVSEAAIEVGYHSFSHFSRAFFEEKGVQPSRLGKAGPDSGG